ncbi:MAG: DUF2721 domain-containing protein [Spongiibacteraceae bacterium]|jgi:hypothetical protein|nr:DUF2721 domain-containing protein [Spongiibacteraceae bacterium]
METDQTLLFAASTVAHSIQLAVAPVFLLTGIGSLLAVLTNRLARIIDRSRTVEARLPTTAESEQHLLRLEMARLAERKSLINVAITLCTICALLICAVIATLFVSTFIPASIGGVVAGLFILAMVSLIVGLLFFLSEIYVAVNRERHPRGWLHPATPDADQ